MQGSPHRLLIGLSTIMLIATAIGVQQRIGAAQVQAALPHAQRLTVQIVAKQPHDPTAFTEGFELDHGVLYESSGNYTRLSLRAENLANGQPVLANSLPGNIFAEGIAIDGDQIVQLTWKNQTAYVYDRQTFALKKIFQYDGEGWGLCFDGTHYVMSNGSATLTVRDPQTFDLLRRIAVDLDGRPIDQLNELECVGNSVYANVWLTDQIVKIDPATGHVTALIDAAGLITPAERASAGTDGVLNGIAYDAQTGNFLITGKLWPWMFTVKFVPEALTYF